MKTNGKNRKTIPLRGAKEESKLVAELDSLIKEGGYANRTEAIRDAVRNMVERKKLVRLEAAVEEDIKWGLHGD
jgi:Arc/MetJ-type ribon-helix-helix transcriptional regulator